MPSVASQSMASDSLHVYREPFGLSGKAKGMTDRKHFATKVRIFVTSPCNTTIWVRLQLNINKDRFRLS